MKSEVEKLQFLTDTFWCYSCLCVGCGAAGLAPCCQSKYKWCCCRMEGSSSEDCAGDQGICSGMQKTFCCITMCEFLPDPCLCAICNQFVIGQKPDGVIHAGESLGQMEQESYMKNTFWCLYCLCTGLGCTSPGEPVLIKGTHKIFCCKKDCETDDCCGTPGTTDSCCYHYHKQCCIKTYCQCMPASNMTPGCGICNFMCCMHNLASTTTVNVNVAVTVDAPNQISMVR